MTTAADISQRALKLARRCIDDCQGELQELAAGDHHLLREAGEIVRTTDAEAPEDRQVEHFAFTLLASAFRDMTGT